MKQTALNPLIDLDPIVYASGFAADSEIKRDLEENGMDPDFREEVDYVHVALGNTKAAVEKILDKFPERKYSMGYLTGPGNFRFDVATIRPYKGNRDPNHKPKYYKEIKDYLIAQFDAIVVEGMEADDAIGIEQYKHPAKDTVIVTIDKDLNMIPGWHYNPRKEDLYDVSLDEADRFFLWQMLVGDSTDNIPGINRIGPKTADKILAEYPDTTALAAKVREMYAEQYGTGHEEALDEIAQLLWIRRNEGERYNVVHE